MDPRVVVWAVTASLAVLTLAKLMRRRQAKLIGTLRSFVQNQIEWNQKRAKAARMARRLAKEKSGEEDTLPAPLDGVLQPNSSQDESLWSEPQKKAA